MQTSASAQPHVARGSRRSVFPGPVSMRLALVLEARCLAVGGAGDERVDFVRNRCGASCTADVLPNLAVSVSSWKETYWMDGWIMDLNLIKSVVQDQSHRG